jgi:hypothetical protein
MESGDDGLESEANVRPRPRLTRAGLPRGCPGARWTAIDRGLSRDPLAQAQLNRSAKGAGTGHSTRYPKCGTTQSDRLLGVSIQQVIAWELGMTRIGASWLRKIAEILDVSPEYFFKDSDSLRLH